MLLARYAVKTTPKVNYYHTEAAQLAAAVAALESSMAMLQATVSQLQTQPEDGNGDLDGLDLRDLELTAQLVSGDVRHLAAVAQPLTPHLPTSVTDQHLI